MRVDPEQRPLIKILPERFARSKAAATAKYVASIKVNEDVPDCGWRSDDRYIFFARLWHYRERRI